MQLRFRIFGASQGCVPRAQGAAGCSALATLLLLFPGIAGAQQIIPIDSTVFGPLVVAVSRSDPTLVAGRSAVAAAQSHLQAAGFGAPAVLSGEIEDVPGGTDLGGAGFRLEIGKEFLTGGRSAASRALAAADLRAAEAELHAAELRTYGATARALAQARGWSAIARRLAAEDSLLIGAEASLRGRFAVGDARYTDVLRLRTERVRVQTDRAQAVAEARMAIAALEGLLGESAVESASLIRAAATAPSAPISPGDLPPAPDVDSLLALSGRVRQAQAAVERAQASRAAVHADQRPRLAAAIGAQRVEGGNGGFVIGPTLGVSITLPFTARRANRAAAEAGDGAVAAALARLAAVRAEVGADLMAAQLRYEAARDRLAVFDAALLRGVRQEREGALAAYRTGELSLIELLDFERALARAEVEQRRASIEAIVALADLISGAAGAPDDEQRGLPAF